MRTSHVLQTYCQKNQRLTVLRFRYRIVLETMLCYGELGEQDTPSISFCHFEMKMGATGGSGPVRNGTRAVSR